MLSPEGRKKCFDNFLWLGLVGCGSSDGVVELNCGTASNGLRSHEEPLGMPGARATVGPLSFQHLPSGEPRKSLGGSVTKNNAGLRGRGIQKGKCHAGLGTSRGVGVGQWGLSFHT